MSADLPLGFNHVQVGRVLGLVDELPARVMDHEEEQVVAMVHIQVVHDSIHALLIGWDLPIGIREKVDEMLLDAPGIARRPAVTSACPQGSIDVALGTPSVINLLSGAFSRTGLHLDCLLAWIALGRDWSHFIDVQDAAVGGRLPSQAFERPLF